MLPLLLTLSAPAAERVLVLPLSGDGSHPGLGEALSVWLNEELATSPALETVPRAEVEAAMPEGSSAPITLNLDYAIGGSWAVLGEELSLSVRVGAETVRARGPVADFVLVEHELADQLLTALGAEGGRAPVPTERLEALAAWGRGLEARRGRDSAEARTALAEAIELDPGFARAREDLAALSGQSDRPDHPMRAAQDAIYAKYPPLTAAPADTTALAGFALRLMALENDGAHCQRAEEMRAFLGFVDHEVSLPSGLTDAALATAVATEARALGFSAMPRSVPQLPDAAYAMPQRRVAGQFATTADFLFREASARNTLGSGLFGALARCHDAAGAQARLAEVGEAALAKGQADQLQQGRPAPGWTLRESLELGWAQLQAPLGSTPELERRLDALTAVREAGDPVQQQLLDRTRDLRAVAKKAVRVEVRAPADAGELAGLLRGAADGADNVVTTEPFGCAAALETHRGELYAWSSQLGTASMEDPAVKAAHRREGEVWVAGLSELGCFAGGTPAHANPEALRASAVQRLDTLPPGALSRGSCGDQVAALRTSLGEPATDASAARWVFAIQRIEHECR